jgi:hypothetical protein
MNEEHLVHRLLLLQIMSLLNSLSISKQDIRDTFVTPRLRFDEKTNQIQGVCYLHGKEQQDLLSFESFDEALQI